MVPLASFSAACACAFHPLDDHYGLSALEAAATAVDTHNAAARWNKALLDNIEPLELVVGEHRALRPAACTYVL